MKSLGISLSSVGLLLLVLLQSTTVHAGTFETGTVTLATTSSASGFTTVYFQHTFAHTPLVFVLPSQAGEEPCAIRVRYVTKVSFEAACIEPAGANGPHTAMPVAYLAAEEGVYTLNHEHALAVLAVHVYTVQASLFPNGPPLREGWEKIQYGDLELPFTIPPAVLTQLQTMNNERGQAPSMPSQPWLTVAVRRLTTTGLDVALERSQVDDGEVLYPEKVGILLASRTQGALTLQDRQGALITYEAARTGKTIQGWDNGCFLYNFRAMFSSSPIVLVSINSRRDTDGGWLRRCALSAQHVGLRVDEDQDGDPERLHAAEIAGLLAFSQAFVSPDLPSQPLAVLPTDTGWTVVRSGPGLPTGNFARRELFMPLSEIPAEQESETPGVHGIAFMLHGYLAIPWAKQTFYNGGIALYDIRNPYNPVLVHNLHHEGIRKNRSIGLQARGALHVIIPATYGIQTWDWTDATRPRLLADLPLPDIEPTGYNNGLWWLFYQAPYVYASGTNLGLYIIDVSDMANPILRKRIPISELGGFRLGTIKIIGNLMYLSRNSGVGSASLDVSDPLQPTLLSVERSTNKHYSHIVNGNRLYAIPQKSPCHLSP